MKTLIKTIAVATSISLLAACGGDGSPAPIPEPPAVPPATPEPACQVEGQNITVPNNGSCLFMIPNFNGGTKTSASCKDGKVSTGGLSGNNIKLNEYTLACGSTPNPTARTPASPPTIPPGLAPAPTKYIANYVRNTCEDKTKLGLTYKGEKATLQIIPTSDPSVLRSYFSFVSYATPDCSGQPIETTRYTILEEAYQGTIVLADGTTVDKFRGNNGKDIFYLDGNNLLYGDLGYPDDSEGYPTVLDTTDFYAKM